MPKFACVMSSELNDHWVLLKVFFLRFFSCCCDEIVWQSNLRVYSSSEFKTSISHSRQRTRSHRSQECWSIVCTVRNGIRNLAWFLSSQDPCPRNDATYSGLVFPSQISLIKIMPPWMCPKACALVDSRFCQIGNTNQQPQAWPRWQALMWQIEQGCTED